MNMKMDMKDFLKMPHPKIAHLSRVQEKFEQRLGSRLYRVISKVVKDKALVNDYCLMEVSQAEPRLLIEYMQMEITQGEGVNGLHTNLNLLRYREWDGRIFKIEPGLMDRLNQSDIGKEAPARFLHLPYPAVYMDFSASPRSSTMYLNEEGVHSALYGVYLTEHHAISRDYGKDLGMLGGLMPVKEGKAYRTLEISFVGRELDEHQQWDEATFIKGTMTLSILDETRSVDDLISDVSQLSKNALSQMKEKAPVEIKALIGEDEFTAREAELGEEPDLQKRFMRQVLKALLYINSNSARVEEVNSLDQIRERLGNVQQKKRAKLERKMMKESNYIRVGAGIMPFEPQPAEGQGGSVRIHWRRGHFRLQHYGKGRTEEKIIWIEPVLVNEEKLTESGDINHKEYNVT